MIRWYFPIIRDGYRLVISAPCWCRCMTTTRCSFLSIGIILKKNGAPVCSWVIQNDSVFLTQVVLQSGLGLFEYDEESVSLTELFRPERIVNKRVFAFWMSGSFVVEYGKVEEDLFGMKEMKVDRRQTITLDSGRVVKSEWSPSAFEE